ncbi:hypothetical protein [Ruegeria sp. HKCCE3926]|uniref:hypothetical protein n=1 Tax=Ruegeria sp. HKCCE3926 TaxID=2794831 RepID=UPI001AEB599A|nr:hypothetical protein [Ruegeria sp. HKCCE3926]
MDVEKDPIIEAADTALGAMHWDGHDPQPIGGLILVLSDALNHAGYAYRDVAIMLEKTAAFLKDFEAGRV